MGIGRSRERKICSLNDLEASPTTLALPALALPFWRRPIRSGHSPQPYIQPNLTLPMPLPGAGLTMKQTHCQLSPSLIYLLSSSTATCRYVYRRIDDEFTCAPEILMKGC